MGNKYVSVGLKVALAAASGFCSWLGWWSTLMGRLPFGILGLLFAAGVLFPYLRRDRFFWYRCLGLIAVSAISFYSAINFGVSLGVRELSGPFRRLRDR